MTCQICKTPIVSKSQAETHHILPRSMGGSDDNFNLVVLCPSCHSRIYVEGCGGKHGQKAPNSVTIWGWVQSSDGRLLHISENQVEDYV